MITSVLVAFAAAAYVPEYSTITSRAAEQHGRGAYQVEQEVTYKKDAESFTVKETWQVLNEGEMRVSIEGRGPLRGLVGGTIVYQGGSKAFVENGPRTQRLGEDWLEPFFYFRSSKWFRQRLVNLRVTPAEALQDRAPLNSEGDPKYEAPSFIRLSRTGGTVDWAIGVSPAVGQAPTIWLEQDQFVVRKYRGANQVTLKADDYAKHEDGFWFPKTRSFQYGTHTVSIRTLAVKSLGKLPPTDTRFKPAALNPAKDALKLPETDGLKEFYSRFR